MLAENRPVSPAVSAKTRPATTPGQGNGRRTRSQMRTPDSPKEEQVTRSPGSGNLTTTPVFSPPSSPDDKDSESESSSSSDTENGSDGSSESIPEGLRPEWVPPVQKDSDGSDSDASANYSPTDFESSEEEGDDDFPIDYSPIRDDAEEDETKEENSILQESKEDSAPHRPPRHSRESHYDRFMNGEAGSSDSDVEDMTLDSSVLERRRYIAEELEENLRATLTVNSQQVEFWKHVPVLNNPVEMNGSADRPPLIVIDLESSRYPHRFRWYQDSENAAVDTIVDCFTGTPNRDQYRSNERRDSGIHVTSDHPAEWQSHREYEPREHRESRRRSRSPDRYTNPNTGRQSSRPPHGRSISPTRESRGSREQQAPSSQELPDWSGNPTPATGTVLKALRPPSYTEFFTTKNKAWGE